LNNIEVAEWDSLSALMEHLASSDESRCVVGHDAEAPRRFYSLSLQQFGRDLRFGIVCSHFGIKPVAVQISDKFVMVGHDNSITAVDLTTGALKFNIHLLAPFYHFITGDEHDYIIVVYETGLMRLSMNGTIEWALDTDLVEGVHQDKGRLLVKTSGNPEPTPISIASGKTTEQPVA
jgi:hypothetical protein